MADVLVHTGYCNGQSNAPIYLYVSYSISQSITGNYSDVTCKMWVRIASGWNIGPWGDSRGSYVGTTDLTFDGGIPNISGDYTLASNKTFRVNHNANGTASAKIYWKWGVYSSWGQTTNPSGSFDITLPTIPRRANITKFDLSVINETQISFTWVADATCDAAQYSVDGGSWTNANLSGSTTISNLSAGNSHTVRLKVRRTDSKLWTEDANIPSRSATTYKYPYLTSVPEFTVGNSLTIGIYNPLKRSCVISIVDAKGTESNGGTITGTTISGFNNTYWCNIWYASLPASTQGKYKARLKCTTGNVNQLSGEVNYYLNTSDTGFKPGFTTSNIINVVNGTHTDISGTDKFIKGHNSLSGSITPMTPSRSATPDYYNVSASGLTTVKKTYSSSNINFTLGNMTTNVFNITAVDKRGFSTTVSKSITLIDYSKPSVTSAKITRQNGIGTKAILAFSGKYTNWSGLLKTNAIQSIKYKIGSSGSWTALPSDATLTSSNGTWALNAILTNDFAVTSQYDLYLQITDLLETVTTNAYTISTADAFIWKDLANKRVGIGKKPDYTLDVQGLINSTDGIRIGSNGDITLRSIKPTGGNGNTTGYRLIGQKTLTAWANCRMSFIISSRHTGSGLFNLAFGCNAGTVSDANIYCQINYFGNTGSGSVVDANSIIAHLKGGTLYFFWKYIDYNSTDILLLTNQDGFIPANGTWVTTIDSNTYGTLKAQTTINKPNMDYIYPVGSIYLSATPTNPGTIFGGTWQQLKNHFLFATNSTSGNKGKDAVSSHTGTAVSGTAISVDQMPSHTHTQKSCTNPGNHNHALGGAFGGPDTLPAYRAVSNNNSDSGGSASQRWLPATMDAGSHTHTITLNNTGGGKTHNHNVSYIEVYVWQRTA